MPGLIPSLLMRQEERELLRECDEREAEWLSGTGTCRKPEDALQLAYAFCDSLYFAPKPCPFCLPSCCSCQLSSFTPVLPLCRCQACPTLLFHGGEPPRRPVRQLWPARTEVQEMQRRVSSAGGWGRSAIILFHNIGPGPSVPFDNM